jgi:hypothetical protein
MRTSCSGDVAAVTRCRAAEEAILCEYLKLFARMEMISSYEQMFCVVDYHKVWDPHGCTDVGANDDSLG